ncbi:MAG: ArsR family transcriptional regulator [Egibacteraceae bacterium]
MAREIARAEQAGIVTSRTVGATRLVRANTDSVIYGPLSDLLLLTFGPAPVLAEELSEVEGITAVCVFGSWAARYQGQPGPPPRDIDVLIVATPDRDEVYDAAERAERRLRKPVQAVIRSPRDWSRPEQDSFLLELRNRPLLRNEW